MSLLNVKVGDTVTVCSDRYEKSETVTKVGRTLATLSDGYQYEIETGARQEVVRGWG